MDKDIIISIVKILVLIFGLICWVLLFIYDWKMCILMFIILWANNITIETTKEK